MIHDTTFAERLLAAVGEQLAFERASACIVVLGGTAMNLLGYVERPTRDVDVLARVDQAGVLVPPEPLPDASQSVHATDLVALAPTDRDLHEAADWIRTQDVSPDFHAVLAKVIEYVSKSRR